MTKGRQIGSRDRIGVIMTTDTVEKDAMERVGKFEIRIERVDSTPEATTRWARRTEVLSAWLLDEWKREIAGKEAC